MNWIEELIKNAHVIISSAGATTLTLAAFFLAVGAFLIGWVLRTESGKLKLTAILAFLVISPIVMLILAKPQDKDKGNDSKPSPGEEFVGTWTGYSEYGPGGPEKERGKQIQLTIEIPQPATKDGKIRVIENGKNEEIYQIVDASQIQNTEKPSPAREVLNVSGKVLTGITWHNYDSPNRVVYSTRKLTKVK